MRHLFKDKNFCTILAKHWNNNDLQQWKFINLFNRRVLTMMFDNYISNLTPTNISYTFNNIYNLLLNQHFDCTGLLLLKSHLDDNDYYNKKESSTERIQKLCLIITTKYNKYKNNCNISNICDALYHITINEIAYNIYRHYDNDDTNNNYPYYTWICKLYKTYATILSEKSYLTLHIHKCNILLNKINFKSLSIDKQISIENSIKHNIYNQIHNNTHYMTQLNIPQEYHDLIFAKHFSIINQFCEIMEPKLAFTKQEFDTKPKFTQSNYLF